MNMKHPSNEGLWAITFKNPARQLLIDSVFSLMDECVTATSDCRRAQFWRPANFWQALWPESTIFGVTRNMVPHHDRSGFDPSWRSALPRLSLGFAEKPREQFTIRLNYLLTWLHDWDYLGDEVCDLYQEGKNQYVNSMKALVGRA